MDRSRTPFRTLILSAALAWMCSTGQLSAQTVEFDYELASWGSDEVLADDCNGKSCDCCGPTWTFSAAALYWERARPDSVVVAFDTADPTRQLNANAFRFDYEPGYEVAARRESGGRGVEVRFFSIDGWDAGHTALVGAPSLVRLNTTPPFDMPDVTEINASYHSELLGFETNVLRSESERFTLLAGFRYLELDENFRFDADAAVFPTSFDAVTSNRLYGGQLGAEAVVWCNDRLTVTGVGKVGVLYNDASNFARYDSGGAAPVTSSDTAERATFLSEAGINATYCLTSCLSLRAGYQMLWLANVATATDQVPVTNFGTMSGIDAGGYALYHGGLLGLELRR